MSIFVGAVLGGRLASLDTLSLVWQASWLVQLVLLLLLLLSVISWAIILVKWRELRRAEQDSEAFLEIYQEGTRIETITEAYETPEERLEKLVAHMAELETIKDWAMGACTEALEVMETNDYWNPALRDPAQRTGRPVDNGTIFD